MNFDTLELNSLNLNTQFRSNGTISNPSFVLTKQLKDIRAVKLKSCCIPLSFYTIDARNNKIYFDEDNSGTILVATIPSGIYTSSTLPAVLETAMNLVGANDYTVTFDVATNKLIFTSSTEFKFMAGSFDSYYEIGITTEDLNSSATTISPSQVIDLSGVKTIHLVSNISGIRVVGKNYNILGSITCEESTNDISTFSDDSNDYVQTQIDCLSEINFSLYDSRFRKLNALKDFSVTINFLTQ